VGDYSDYEFDDVKSDIVDKIEVFEDPIKYARHGNIRNQSYDGDKTPTREREASMTVEELQIAARKLNLCLATPAHERMLLLPVMMRIFLLLPREDRLEPRLES
jgi:hypothetical protein